MRIARLAASVAALALLGLCATAAVGAGVSFIKAWGWGVRDGKHQSEKCATTCQRGVPGGGAGQLAGPFGIAVDRSGHMFVADAFNDRVEEFSSSGAFVRTWGWGVSDGKQQFENCTTSCRTGLEGSGAGQFDFPNGVAVDRTGDVFVADAFNNRVEEFSSSGAFVKTWGWGVRDGKHQLEKCTTTCQYGLQGSGAGAFITPIGIAVDRAGHVFVTDYSGNNRVDEFSSSGALVKAWGWGVRDGKRHLETCTTSCLPGLRGGGAGEFNGADGIAVNGSGKVFVTDYVNQRIDEFSSAGAFITAWGWGVRNGKHQFETCATACRAGLYGGGAGQFYGPDGVAVDGSGDVFVADWSNDRIDELR